MDVYEINIFKIYKKMMEMSSIAGKKFVIIIESKPLKCGYIFEEDIRIVGQLGLKKNINSNNFTNYIIINESTTSEIVQKLKLNGISYIIISTDDGVYFRKKAKLDAKPNKYEEFRCKKIITKQINAKLNSEKQEVKIANSQNNKAISTNSKKTTKKSSKIEIERPEDIVMRVRGPQKDSQTDIEIQNQINEKKGFKRMLKKDQPTDKPTWGDMRKARYGDFFK